MKAAQIGTVSRSRSRAVSTIASAERERFFRSPQSAPLPPSWSSASCNVSDWMMLSFMLITSVQAAMFSSTLASSPSKALTDRTWIKGKKVKCAILLLEFRLISLPKAVSHWAGFLPFAKPTVSDREGEMSRSTNLITPSVTPLSLTIKISWLPWKEDCQASHQPSEQGRNYRPADPAMREGGGPKGKRNGPTSKVKCKVCHTPTGV